MPFTAEELAEMRAADEEIDASFAITGDEIRQAKALDAEARRQGKDKQSRSKAEYQRAYRDANREAIAEYQRAYYVANREAIAEYQRAYRIIRELKRWFREDPQALIQEIKAWKESEKDGNDGRTRSTGTDFRLGKGTCASNKRTDGNY